MNLKLHNHLKNQNYYFLYLTGAVSAVFTKLPGLNPSAVAVTQIPVFSNNAIEYTKCYSF